MSAYTISTNALKIKVLQKCGEVTDGTSSYDTGQPKDCVLDYLNKAQLFVLSGGNEFVPELSKPWPWAISPNSNILLLQPNIDTLSFSVTYGSTAVTISGIPKDQFGNNISIQGWWLRITSLPQWYKITAHTIGATTCTIDFGYADATASLLPGNVCQLDYVITPTSGNGVLRLVEPFVVYRPQDQQGDQEAKIYFMNEMIMLREYPMINLEGGAPTFFCITQRDQENNIYIRFNKYAIDPTRVEVRCIEVPTSLVDSTGNFPIVPVEYVDILLYIASHWLCLDKNDDRADSYLKLAMAKGKAMIVAEEKQKQNTGKNRGRLTPRLDLYWRGKRYLVQDVT